MAAPFDWSADIPAGALKKHKISKKIRKEARARTEVFPFVTVEPGFGKQNGDTLTIVRTLQLSENADYSIASEGTGGPNEEEFVVNKVEIVVGLIGNSVPFTNFAKHLTPFDLEAAIKDALADDQAVALDSLAATSFKSTPLKYVATGAASGTFESGTATLTCASNLNVFHIGKLEARLFGTQKAPKIGGDFVGIVNTVSYEGVMNDDTFAEWVKYTTPEKMYKNEVGRVRSTRIIRTNHGNALGELEGGVAGEGIFFGEDACVMAEAMSPEMRVKKDDAKYGLVPGVGWFAIVGFGLPFDTFGLARVGHFTTAP